MNQRTKNIIFLAVTLLFFLILFVGIEFTLRYTYPQFTSTLVEEVSYDQLSWYKINRSYLKKYFSSTDPLIPEFKPSLFLKEKKKNSLRIFCLGESSMFGVPYQMTANIPGILRTQLRRLYPEKEIEVVNLGASAINTNVIRNFAHELLRFQPDIILIYTGHNEFYGPDGIGASWVEKQFPFLTRWKYQLNNLAVVNLLENIFSGKPSPESLHDVNLMKQVSQKAAVKLHSSETERIFKNFENNVTSIVEIFQSHNIPVIISDVTSNLTFAPFEYDSVTAQQAGALLTNSAEENIQKLRTFISEHNEDSFSRFLLAKQYLSLAKYDSAKIYFEEARDCDFLKFRAPGKINAVLRSVAKETHSYFFSSDSIFAVNSLHGISDTSLFWEHLHPKANGYYLIAGGFLDALQKEHLLPASSAAPLPFNTDSLHICWFDLAFGDCSIKNLTTKWPFKNFTVNTVYYPSAPMNLQKIVDEVFAMGKIWDEACYESAQIFWKADQLPRAITTYRALIEEYPYNFYAQYLLANALSQQGKTVEAAEHYNISITSNPRYPYSQMELGLLQINSGKFDEAVRLLTGALKISQQENLIALQSTIYYGLGTAYANKKMFKEAMDAVARSLQLQPNNRDALALRQKLLSFLQH